MCVCVCVYVYMCVCVCVRTCTCTHAFAVPFACVCTCVCILFFLLIVVSFACFEMICKAMSTCNAQYQNEDESDFVFQFTPVVLLRGVHMHQ